MNQILGIDQGQDKQFRTIIESVPNGLVIVDAEGNIILCNTETEKLFGYDSGELVGKKIEILVPERQRAAHPARRKTFGERPEKRQMGAGRDLTGQRKDGSEIPVEIGLNHIRTEEGSFVVAAIVDITERKMIDDRLRQKSEEMEQFVYTVSHDLKAPLVASMSFLDFLREDIENKNFENIQDSLDRLVKAHRRMQELISDLLQISRIGRLEMHRERFSLKGLLMEVREELAEKIFEKGARIVIAEAMPEIFADRKWIHQVFENLLSNALKYGVNPKPIIELIFRIAEGNIEIAVCDNGPGIESQYHEKIFGLFQRLTPEGDGTGVGLTIVLRVMQLHGGRAWVESTPGQGARFWVSVPCVNSEQGHV